MSKGDIGIAQDLLADAERDIEPAIDWGHLADVLALVAPGKTVTKEQRDSVIALARGIAGENAAAQALVDIYVG